MKTVNVCVRAPKEMELHSYFAVHFEWMCKFTDTPITTEVSDIARNLAVSNALRDTKSLIPLIETEVYIMQLEDQQPACSGYDTYHMFIDADSDRLVRALAMFLKCSAEVVYRAIIRTSRVDPIDFKMAILSKGKSNDHCT